jgi:hypothetical protein
MKLLNVPLGLLFNFHEVMLVDRISRTESQDLYSPVQTSLEQKGTNATKTETGIDALGRTV